VIYLPTWESDPLVLKLRAGTISDPFVSLTESFIIPSGCKILLSELPDQTNKLTISGFSETSSTTPEIDTFYCNYNTREVFFNDGNVGDSISISYWGRGLIYIPISSVYTLLDSNGDVLETLEDQIMGGGFVKQIEDQIMGGGLVKQIEDQIMGGGLVKQIDYQIGLIYGVRW
jgi:hypothetical protein